MGGRGRPHPASVFNLHVQGPCAGLETEKALKLIRAIYKMKHAKVKKKLWRSEQCSEHAEILWLCSSLE